MKGRDNRNYRFGDPGHSRLPDQRDWRPFHQKITLITYFDNAEGIRAGQPVDLQGVAIGNVQTVRVVPGRQIDPVQVVMRVNAKFQPFLREDSKATITTAG
ncbi:MAG: MCE family protein, partial [Candidatus Angelobacter sp.]